MIYGAINVTGLLIDHGVWPHVAWLLSVMIDQAMCVSLIGDRVLHQYARQDRWVTALQWSTAVMTLILNTARPALAQDWVGVGVGVGIHTAGPVLLLLVTEAAGSFQRQLTAIIRDLQTNLTNAETAERHNEIGPGRHRGLLTQIHPALERILGPNVHHPAVLELLPRCGGPAGLRAAGRAKLAN
ncbi:hypothetical protein Vau01_100380 [Virgisporangium aurantiacum]|uniref:Uncharacterized protein n=1 Tax=Virgisporangium aurantiacum TaxID=175570 RepID=A0A8J3ZEF1_9ACTN|nr:hypothetical protein Vau01_100380 [Virgisporangium aurantiacum]